MKKALFFFPAGAGSQLTMRVCTRAESCEGRRPAYPQVR